MHLVAALGQFKSEFCRNDPAAAVGGITGDADLHRLGPFRCTPVMLTPPRQLRFRIANQAIGWILRAVDSPKESAEAAIHTNRTDGCNVFQQSSSRLPGRDKKKRPPKRAP